MVKRFSHAFDFCFEVDSDLEDASDVTADMLITVIRLRIFKIETTNKEEILEACGLYDTSEI